VVGYGTFSLFVIHKEGLCPSSGDINKMMMMMMMIIKLFVFTALGALKGFEVMATLIAASTASHCRA
jgi:flagellar biosynthesis protein FlhB